MANSRIVIDFLAVPGVNQFLNIREQTLGLNINFVFKNTRTGTGVVAIPKYVSGHGYNTYISNNYRDAFNLDFNAANLFTITSTIGSYSSGLGSVTIEANYPDADFVENGKTISASLAIYNETGATPITIDSYSFSAAATPNTHARVNITTSVLATAINSPVVIDPNTANPFYVDVLRGSTNVFEVENAEGSIASLSITAPVVLDANNFNVTVSSSPNGGTVTIEEKVYSGLSLQYSLDDDEYQTDNTYSGLLAGDYTLYIKDSIGGTAQIAFTVSEFGIYTPYFYISKANSIRFANRITWGDAANYKNDENTLGAEVDVDLAYSGCQNFKSANVITTQFKSNYQNNVVKILRDPLLFPPTEATSNILLYSEDLTNSIWNKNAVTIDNKKVIADNIYDYHNISQNVSKGTNSGEYTFSAFIKAAEFNIVTLSINSNDYSAQVFTGFNCITKSFFGSFGFSGFTFIESGYSDEANGYIRVFIKASIDTTVDLILKIEVHNTSGNKDYTGNGINGLFVDKLQFQEGGITPYLQTTNQPVFVAASDGSLNVPVVKKSSNIGIKDKRDAYKYYLGDGKIGIAFLSGNIYDYDTNAITGTHSMAGTLPEWGVVGAYITIANAWYIIEDTYYDEERGCDLLVYSGEYTGKVPVGAIEGNVIAGSIYNDFNFEIYEFTIDMVDYLNQTIQVQIIASDSHFETVTHLSEKLDVAINFKKNVEIYYWNDDNTDVFYATGIRHLINVEVTKQEGVADEESETNKTDTTALLLSAQLYELKKFIFEPVSEEIWRKIMIALSHKNVFINGVQYVKNGNFDTEGPLEQSNLYVLKATMLKTGIVYNADSADGADFNTGSLEIPGLIQTEIGFVKY